MVKIGNEILSIRKKNGMTQKEFAELFGVTRQAVSNWENNKSYPDLEIVIKISDIYSVSLDQLLKEDIKMIRAVDKDRHFTQVMKKILLVCVLAVFAGIIYFSVCNFQHKVMYKDVLSAGFKKEITEEFIEKYQGYYAVTESNVDYLVEPKSLGPMELDINNFQLVARKGKEDITIRISGEGDISLSLYPGSVQIDEDGNLKSTDYSKLSKAQQEKVDYLLNDRKAEIKDITNKAVEKWKQINKIKMS